MRYMLMIKADENLEAGTAPSEEAMVAMDNYNRDMIEAGIRLSADGLHPSSAGARVVFAHGKQTVVDGPFAEAKELIAGFWLIEVGSKEEAVAWATRCPVENGSLEIRRVFSEENFDAEYQEVFGGASS